MNNDISFYIKTQCPKCNVEVIQLINTNASEDKRIVCGNCGTVFRLPVIVENTTEEEVSCTVEKPYLPVLSSKGLYWIN